VLPRAKPDREPWRPRLRFSSGDLIFAWLIATVFSGVPSTVHALMTGTDPLEATRAAGAMLVATESPLAELVAAAAVVHGSVSMFWTLVFGATLPRSRVMGWAVAGSAAVALLDLKIIAPMFFPSVASLSFWPQFADHLAWGALLGATLQLRSKRRTLSRAP
jgi:hypothetical protein